MRNGDVRFSPFSSVKDMSFAQGIHGVVRPGNLDLFAAEAAPTVPTGSPWERLQPRTRFAKVRFMWQRTLDAQW